MKPTVETEHCQLFLGDCRDVLPFVRADSVVTDPPYGVNLVTKTNDCRGETFDRGESMRASQLYEDGPEEVAALIRETMPKLIAISGRALIFSGQNMLHEYPKPVAIGCVYLSNGAGRCAWGFQCFQPILFYGKDPFIEAGLGGRPNSFRTEQMNREKIDHPCPKPLAWMLWAVNRASLRGWCILDPFAGSGTTAVACIRTGRRCIAIEKEPKYFEIMVRRVQEAEGVGSLFDPANLKESPDLFAEAV